MREHTTHHDDCGCLSERHAQEIAAANETIKRLQRKLDDAEKGLELVTAKWEAAVAERRSAERQIAALTEALSGGKPDGR